MVKGQMEEFVKHAFHALGVDFALRGGQQRKVVHGSDRSTQDVAVVEVCITVIKLTGNVGTNSIHVLCDTNTSPW